MTAPSSNESSDLPKRGSWEPVADAPINTDGFDDDRNSHSNYDRATAYGSRCNNSFQKHLSSTTPREQYSKMFRTANVDTDTHATSTTNRRTQNTHSSPSSSSKPLDDCYAAEGDGADFYENQNQSEQTNEEQAASAALEESFNGMLMAWYQSGYATGRYQALLEQSKKSSNSQSHSHSQSQSQYRNQPPLQQQYQGQSQNNRNQPHEPHSQSQSYARGGQPYPPKGSHS